MEIYSPQKERSILRHIGDLDWKGLAYHCNFNRREDRSTSLRLRPGVGFQRSLQRRFWVNSKSIFTSCNSSQLRVRSYGQDENYSTNKEVEGLPLPAELIDLYSLDKITFLSLLLTFLCGASGERKELERRATLESIGSYSCAVNG